MVKNDFVVRIKKNGCPHSATIKKKKREGSKNAQFLDKAQASKASLCC